MNAQEKHQEALLSASNTFIAASLLAALVLDWLPWSGIWLALRPDFAALVLLYWCTHKPFRIGIGIAWLVGIFVDVADASLFGQHALAYAVLAFAGGALHRRMQMLGLSHQMLQIFPVLLLTYAIYAAVYWQVRGYVEWRYFLGCVTTGLLWIPLTLLLQALRQPRSKPDPLS